MKFKSIPEIVSDPGLRIVIVRDFPSPWSQAARAIFEHKGLEYSVGAQTPGGENEEHGHQKVWTRLTQVADTLESGEPIG